MTNRKLGPKQEELVLQVFNDNYYTAARVMKYVVSKNVHVTTARLIDVGLLTGPQVNHVRAVVTVLGWALLYPCGKTQRWWPTPLSKELFASTHRYSQ